MSSSRPSSSPLDEKSPPLVLNSHDEHLVNFAQDAADTEKQQSFLASLRLHRVAVCWSLAMSTVIFMEGYDTMLVGNLIAQPAFQSHYGVQTKPGSYQIPAPWQSGLNSGSSCGQLIGLLLAGYMSERIGLRKTIILSLGCITGMIFIQVFAPSLAVLVVGQVLFGIPLGMLQTTPVVYAMEVAPVGLRGYLTAYINLCWAIGHLIGAGVLRGTLQLTGQWAYRMPFALQWFWPLVLIPLLSFAPESPWWLVRKGRLEESKIEQRRLISPDHDDIDAYIDKQTALMIVTTEHERQINAQSSYLSCFQGPTDRRRTLIVIGVYCIQTLSGNPLRSSSTYFLQQGGLPSTQSFNMTVISYALALVGGFVAWGLIPLAGRRTIFNWSLLLMLILMILIGALGIPQTTTSGSSYSWAIGSILIVSSFLYNATSGPLTNTICVEIPSTLLRSKSVALARWFYTAINIVAGIITPYQLNSTAWNWGAKTGFFWAGGCAISVLFGYFFVPETKGRTTAEMDLLFERKVCARHSAKASVEIKDVLESAK